MRITQDRRSAAADDARLAEVAVALEQVMSWLRRTTRPAQWSPAALSSLDALERRGPMRVSDLVAHERITQPGMTGLVTRLEAAGLVERSPDPADGRATLVAVTDAGRHYLRELHAHRAERLAGHLRTLAPEQQQALSAAADALTALAATAAPDERS